jgi:S1-C subfamily serine protease
MNGRGANLTFLLCVAAVALLPACKPPPAQEPPVEAPAAEEAQGSTTEWPLGPQSLAEMNPVGMFAVETYTGMRWHVRCSIFESTTLGRAAVEEVEEESKPPLGLSRWQRVLPQELYEIALYVEEQSPDFAYALLRVAARTNHADAQWQLALAYKDGRGVGKNPEKSAFWARQASRNGSALGSSYLAHYSLTGYGVKKDLAKARELLHLAAERDEPWAQAELAGSLLGLDTNWGHEPNYKAAQKWALHVATLQPDDQNASLLASKAKGLNVLGVIYARGLGVPKNETEALAYYYLAKSIAVGPKQNKVFEQNIVSSERQMSPSARQYSQLRAQELRPLYFEQAPAQAEAPASEGLQFGFGSGVFVTQEGHLLTAAHVVENAAKVKARLNEETLEAEIIAIDHPNDVALLKVDAKVDAAPVRSSAGVELGNQVFTIGFPNMLLQGTEPKFTEGTISSTSGMRDDPRQFQVSVQVQPGNSGGALFDDNGNVVGLVVARLDDEATSQLTGSLPQNVNYAVKSSYALPLLESLKAELMTEHRRPWFGGNRDQVVSRAKKSSVPLIVELKPPRQ